ncbi:hypothetical protein DM860_003509 [Cuscuta australis]|uniref:Peptidase C1A papain C-terminal domain-containing protein n=1 Tax=Cuscuta australis TaxID=267555 RepID=A0A328DHT3_9ASTE|nr:hypothetical protein DM860_003509 [Cuscuta australis]
MRAGCCWAFSAVAAVEGLNKLKTGKLVPLSEQQLLDCDGGDDGCNGGLMDTAFKFIHKNNGLAAENGYDPYAAREGLCNKTAVSSAMISGYEKVPANNEFALLQAVAHQRGHQRGRTRMWPPALRRWHL